VFFQGVAELVEAGEGRCEAGGELAGFVDFLAELLG